MSLFQISDGSHPIFRQSAASRARRSAGVWRRLLIWTIRTRMLEAEKLLQRHPTWRQGSIRKSNECRAEDRFLREVQYMNGWTRLGGTNASGHGRISPDIEI